VRAKHEEGDQAILRLYRENLKPGMTRKEVEDNLRKRGIQFSRYGDLKPHQRWFSTSGVEISNLAAYTDVIRIRNEHVSWICSSMVVFIGIQFAASDDTHAAATQETDRLTEINLYDQSADCP